MCFNWSRWVALLDTRSSDGPSENQFNASDHPESVPYECPATHSSFGLSYVFMPSIIYTRQRLRLGNSHGDRVTTFQNHFRQSVDHSEKTRPRQGPRAVPGAPDRPRVARTLGPMGAHAGTRGPPRGVPPGASLAPFSYQGWHGFFFDFFLR